MKRGLIGFFVVVFLLVSVISFAYAAEQGVVQQTADKASMSFVDWLISLFSNKAPPTGEKTTTEVPKGLPPPFIPSGTKTGSCTIEKVQECLDSCPSVKNSNSGGMFALILSFLGRASTTGNAIADDVSQCCTCPEERVAEAKARVAAANANYKAAKEAYENAQKTEADKPDEDFTQLKQAFDDAATEWRKAWNDVAVANGNPSADLDEYTFGSKEDGEWKPYRPNPTGELEAVPIDDFLLTDDSRDLYQHWKDAKHNYEKSRSAETLKEVNNARDAFNEIYDRDYERNVQLARDGGIISDDCETKDGSDSKSDWCDFNSDKPICFHLQTGNRCGPCTDSSQCSGVDEGSASCATGAGFCYLNAQSDVNSGEATPCTSDDDCTDKEYCYIAGDNGDDNTDQGECLSYCYDGTLKAKLGGKDSSGCDTCQIDNTGKILYWRYECSAGQVCDPNNDGSGCVDSSEDTDNNDEYTYCVDNGYDSYDRESNTCYNSGSDNIDSTDYAGAVDVSDICAGDDSGCCWNEDCLDCYNNGNC